MYIYTHVLYGKYVEHIWENIWNIYGKYMAMMMMMMMSW
jgi:hypothetical protein